MDIAVEGLALGIDGLNALAVEHAEQLGAHGIDAVDELLEVLGHLLATRVIERTLHIINDRKQGLDQLLGCTGALVQALLRGATTVVLPIGLQRA